MSNSINVWLEHLASKWIREGKTRLPVEPPRTIGWSQRGLLKANSSAVIGVQLQVDFSGQMQTHTIQFDGFDNNLDVGNGPDARTAVAEAEILWSVEGNTIRRLVSVLDGQSVSGAAQAVAINIRDVTLNGNAVEYSVGMSVVPGLRASTEQPPTLRINGINSAVPGVPIQFGTGLVPAGSMTWTVPANCGAISAMISSAVVGVAANLDDSDLLIAFSVSNTQIIKRLDARGSNLWIPLFSGTRTITVTNNSAAKTIHVSCTLGIDG